MVEEIKFLDQVHVQKYVYLISQFVDGKISTSDFESFFLEIRRGDSYWLSGLFDEKLGQILDTIFLDVSDYTDDSAYDPNDINNINYVELIKRLKKSLGRIASLI